MHAVIHIGLHKTGTTYIQHLANSNQKELARLGIYYSPMEGYPAHHDAAWKLLRGNPGEYEAMAGRAAKNGARLLLTSSEDLESLVFRPQLARLLVDTLADNGITEVTFVLYIRRQDEMFWSHFSELSKHGLYVDPLQLLSDVLRLGYYYVDNPKPGRQQVPFWFFCFDYLRHISAFEQRLNAISATPCQLKVFSFDQRKEYPGEELFDLLDAHSALGTFPASSQHNARLSPHTVCGNYVANISDQLDSLDLAHDLCLVAEDRTNIGALEKQTISRAVHTKFAGGNEELLRKFS